MRTQDSDASSLSVLTLLSHFRQMWVEMGFNITQLWNFRHSDCPKVLFNYIKQWDYPFLTHGSLRRSELTCKDPGHQLICKAFYKYHFPPLFGPIFWFISRGCCPRVRKTFPLAVMASSCPPLSWDFWWTELEHSIRKHCLDLTFSHIVLWTGENSMIS